MAVTPDFSSGLALFAANYLKRWLEGNVYDRAFDTETAKKLKSLDAKTRYAIEFGLNLLTVFFDQALAGDAGLKRMVKEVGLDAAPEISKRLINHAKTPEEKHLIRTLLALEHADLLQLLQWFYGIDSERRGPTLKQISTLSLEELARLAQMAPDERDKLIGLFVSERGRWLSAEDVQAIEGATEKIKAFRSKVRDGIARRRGRE